MASREDLAYLADREVRLNDLRWLQRAVRVRRGRPALIILAVDRPLTWQDSGIEITYA